MAQEHLMKFVLYAVAFALGIASFIISVLSAASSTAIIPLLSIAVISLGFAGISSEGGDVSAYSQKRRRR